MNQRIFVGLISLPIALIPVWLGGLWSAALLLGIAMIGGHEFYSLMRKGNFRPAYPLGMLWIMLLVIHPVRTLLPGALSTIFEAVTSNTILILGLIATLIYALFQTEQPLFTWFSTTIGALYIGLLSHQMLSLRLIENGLWWLLLGVFVTWANDSAAYFTGVSIGRYKLWPRLSPKKTWEGTIAGWLVAAFVGALFVFITPLLPFAAPISPLKGALLGFVGGILALFGDLSISMLKRQIGVKDSGNIFPGHGGMLDRLDSPLFVLSFLYQYVLLTAG